MKYNSVLAFGFLMCVNNPVFAHTGVGGTHTALAGFIHPWQGLDHLLVMLGVGFWASLLGGQARWLLPLGFLSLMLLGALLGFSGVDLPYVEMGVSTSVLILGLIMGTRWLPKTHIALFIVAVFALFHGYVHAAEVEQDTQAKSYVIGFMTATAVLHALGLGLGKVSGRMLTVFRWSLAVVYSLVGVSLLFN